MLTDTHSYKNDTKLQQLSSIFWKCEETTIYWFRYPWSILTDEDNSKLLQIAKLRLFLNLTIHHGKLVWLHRKHFFLFFFFSNCPEKLVLWCFMSLSLWRFTYNYGHKLYLLLPLPILVLYYQYNMPQNPCDFLKKLSTIHASSFIKSLSSLKMFLLNFEFSRKF